MAGLHDVHTTVHRVGGVFFSAFALGLFVLALRPRRAREAKPAVDLAMPGMVVGGAR